MKYEKFEDLPIWKLSVEIAKSVYDLTSWENFKAEYSLINQVRNSIMSVNSNIVEWFENYKDFPKFLQNAKGYVQRLRSQLYICMEVGILDKKSFEKIWEKLIELVNQIWWLIYYMKKPKESKLSA
jgi:four helix bundle protein